MVTMKRRTAIFLVLLFMAVIIGGVITSARAISWEGSSAGGGGGGSSANSKGYSLRTTGDNCIGYRFSCVDKDGNNRVTKVIDVFRNTEYGNYEYENGYKFDTKYNKKQLIANQNGDFSTSRNTVNCYTETTMGFATSLPVPSGMETWQNYTSNLNKVLDKLGVGNIDNLKNGDKILVEPIYDIRLETIYHAVTVTETAIYGKYLLGAYSDGGSSPNADSWGFISNYTNKHYPNSLFTPDGQGLWSGVSAASSRLTFYAIINDGWGVGIAYTETRKEFEPTLTVIQCQAWQGAKSTRDFHYGTSRGSTFAQWTYKDGYPSMDNTIWYSVNFPAEDENVYVKQTVSVEGGGSTSRKVWSDSGVWYDVALSPTTIAAGDEYYIVRARVDWIDSDGTVKKFGAEKTFYIPVKPVITRDRITAYSVTGKTQAYSGSSGSSGKIYFGQSVRFQYRYSAETSWVSVNTVTGTAKRWNGSSWSEIIDGGKDVSVKKANLSSASAYKRNSSIGLYTVPVRTGTGTNASRLRFDFVTSWNTDPEHTTETTTYYLPISLSDVAIVDMKLVDKNGSYVDRENLTVGDELTIHYFYKNNTDCTVYVNGYNDDKSKIDGIFEIASGKTIEVAGGKFTVPNQRTFTIWGGVYLDGVARGNTDYESNGKNNANTYTCKSQIPLSLVPITPNAPYRENTTVIVSYYLKNDANVEYTPSTPVTVRLRVYNKAGTLLDTQSKSVIVPAKDKNLVYFKWTVPDGLNGKDVTVKADICDGGSYYGEVSRSRATTDYPYYTTPDTRYEEKAPAGFKVPSAPAVSQNYAEWWEYTYSGGKFVKVDYAVGLPVSNAETLTPATGSTAEKVNGTWTMKSGYGTWLEIANEVVGVTGYTFPNADAYTDMQYGYAAYPEYGYEDGDGKTTTLYRNGSQWNFSVLSPKANHYTPLYFPDGDYIVKVVKSDMWTPSGMVQSVSTTKPIIIKESAYDDWYVGRR